MFIPKRIKIGFQKRDDTFTGKLSYIIYYDEKGKLRKEASWNSWKDDSIETVEFDNLPQNGYIFNKGVQRDGYWGSGRSVIRVYDSRDFEFEISVDNLMGLLMHSDVSKRDIVEQCVFAWEGTELVLLPINSKEYQASVEYTNKQDQKISAKELVEGYTYQAKKLDTPLIYMGSREWFDWNNGYLVNGKVSRRYERNAGYAEFHESKGKKHVFYDGVKFFTKTPADLSAILVNTVDDNYANLVDKFFETDNSQKITSVVPSKKTDLQSSYYHYLYFVTKEHLLNVQISYDNRYNNGDYTMCPKISYSGKTLTYPSSLHMTSSYSQHVNSPEFDKIAKEFSKEFSQYVSRDKYQGVTDIATQWLLERGVTDAYSVVLENGKTMIKSY